MEKKTTQKYKGTKDCVHHWIIEPASGRDSKGKCKKCKTEQNFSNSSWDSSKGGWGNVSPKGKKSVEIENEK